MRYSLEREAQATVVLDLGVDEFQTLLDLVRTARYYYHKQLDDPAEAVFRFLSAIGDQVRKQALDRNPRQKYAIGPVT